MSALVDPDSDGNNNFGEYAFGTPPNTPGGSPVFLDTETIGDDTLEKQAQGYVVPESFTHGSSAQRVSWLKRGLETGNPSQCDTFSENP